MWGLHPFDAGSCYRQGGTEECRKAPFPGCGAQLTVSAPRVTTLSLHKYIGKMVRPMRTEEYLHDYLLEDALVTVSLRRLTWKTPLHFENKIYTDVHYGQVSNKGTVSTRNLSSRGRIRGEARGDVPKGLKKCEGFD